MTTKFVTVHLQGAELIPELSAEQFADVCRQTGLQFLHGAAEGWGKEELAAWLLGPYAAVSARPQAEAVAPMSGGCSPSGIVRTGAVEELVDLVRVAVSSTLAELKADETTSITYAIRERRVAWARGAGGLVWVPVDHPRMRLEARVMSLFAVDYLLRPEPYQTDLEVCPHCDHVSFDGAGRSCERCHDRARTSDIRCTESSPGLIPTTRKSAG